MKRHVPDYLKDVSFDPESDRLDRAIDRALAKSKTQQAEEDGYPFRPGHKAAGPSAEAAECVAGSAKNLRSEVLRIMILTAHSMTADEIAAELKKSVLSVRPRVSELHRMGLIHPAGGRGKNDSGMSATRWEVVRPLVSGGAQ